MLPEAFSSLEKFSNSFAKSDNTEWLGQEVNVLSGRNGLVLGESAHQKNREIGAFLENSSAKLKSIDALAHLYIAQDKVDVFVGSDQTKSVFAVCRLEYAVLLLCNTRATSFLRAASSSASRTTISLSLIKKGCRIKRQTTLNPSTVSTELKKDDAGQRAEIRNILALPKDAITGYLSGPGLRAMCLAGPTTEPAIGLFLR